MPRPDTEQQRRLEAALERRRQAVEHLVSLEVETHPTLRRCRASWRQPMSLAVLTDANSVSLVA